MTLTLQMILKLLQGLRHFIKGSDIVVVQMIFAEVEEALGIRKLERDVGFTLAKLSLFGFPLNGCFCAIYRRGQIIIQREGGRKARRERWVVGEGLRSETKVNALTIGWTLQDNMDVALIE